MKKRESLCLVSGNVNWCNHYGKQSGGSSKIKNRAILWFSNSTSGVFIQRKWRLTQKYLYTPNPIHCTIVYNSHDMKTTCPLINEWIKILLYLHNRTLSSHKKNKEILPFVTTCMDFECIRLSKISQREEYCMISFICEIYFLKR